MAQFNSASVTKGVGQALVKRDTSHRCAVLIAIMISDTPSRLHRLRVATSQRQLNQGVLTIYASV